MPVGCQSEDVRLIIGPHAGGGGGLLTQHRPECIWVTIHGDCSLFCLSRAPGGLPSKTANQWLATIRELNPVKLEISIKSSTSFDIWTLCTTTKTNEANNTVLMISRRTFNPIVVINSHDNIQYSRYLLIRLR